jgi:hypothetical protein
MTNSASATVEVRFGYFVLPIVGFRGMRPDPGGAFNDSKSTGFRCFGPREVSDWIADRPALGPTDIGV